MTCGCGCAGGDVRDRDGRGARVQRLVASFVQDCLRAALLWPAGVLQLIGDTLRTCTMQYPTTFAPDSPTR
jgi:hypothetical protein